MSQFDVFGGPEYVPTLPDEQTIVWKARDDLYELTPVHQSQIPLLFVLHLLYLQLGPLLQFIWTLYIRKIKKILK